MIESGSSLVRFASEPTFLRQAATASGVFQLRDASTRNMVWRRSELAEKAKRSVPGCSSSHRDSASKAHPVQGFGLDAVSGWTGGKVRLHVDGGDDPLTGRKARNYFHRILCFIESVM
jgi:hypothetical protein